MLARCLGRRALCSSLNFRDNLIDRFPNMGHVDDEALEATYDHVQELQSRYRFNDTELNYLMKRQRAIIRPGNSLIQDGQSKITGLGYSEL